MKPLITWFLLITLGILLLIASYNFGVIRGEEALALRNKAAFVISLSAIEKIRSGEEEQAIKIIENQCYVSALCLLGDGGSVTEPGVTNLLADLVIYRSTFATNRANWTPVETQLEIILQKNRRPNPITP